MRAQLAIGDEPRFRWLCDRSEIGPKGRPVSWRPELLGELGRLDQEQGREKMLEIAEQLCQRKPETAEGLELIRKTRLELPGTPLALTNALVETTKRFLSENPEMTDEQLSRALEEVYRVIVASRA